MSNASFYWHDYETFGIDSRRDRPSQFAGQRTTLDLEPIGEPLTIYCKPAPDILPSPGSCLITGITPQHAEAEGVIESDFAARIHEELAQPGTCGAGYNSLRFDDEFTRNLLYRNFYDPYTREWENGNSRWDVIDLARMCCALRPQGIEWPQREDGAISFRLEDLSAANHLAHDRAHDALSDVQATIALARLLRTRQPRLFEFYFGLRRKQRAFDLLDCIHRTPVLHVSSRYPSSRGCLAMVVPLTAQPDRPNCIVVYDLSVDPTPLIELDADEIADRIFTPRADLPEGIERIPLKAVHANRSPALAPISVLAGVDTARIGLDTERCMANLKMLRNAPDVAEKLRRVYARTPDEKRLDPELSIYGGGFTSDADRRALRDVRATAPEELGNRPFLFSDSRYSDLLFRYRARNWPHTLTADENLRWTRWCTQRLTTQTDLTTLTFDTFFDELRQLRAVDGLTNGAATILDALELWAVDKRQSLQPLHSVLSALPIE
jgi:exodeoxyribonuclease I